MKNKEIEELLNMLKKCAREDKATLKLNEIACKTILSYIEQLENNRDKAIEYVEEKEIITSDINGIKTYGLSYYNFDYKELLDILKGDSDE